MKLYLAAGQYVGTQADAKRIDKAFKPVDVPTDKDGLIAYLNAASQPYLPAPEDDGFDLIAPLGQDKGFGGDKWQSAADKVLAPPDADGIVQRIMGAKGYELKRYASAVAQAFTKLAGG